MAGDVEVLWPVSDIVYTSIVGVVMLMALLEWFLWIAAFLYCLWKVFIKAEHWTVRVLAVLVGVAFTLLRAIFLPIMVVTLPLPSVISRVWPEFMVTFLQWFAFWSFAGLLTIPWLFCVYQIVTHQLGRTKRIKQVLDEVSAPKVVIVMPCYKEEPDILVAAVNSVVDCDYPPSCIHVFLSFDGDQEDELYLNTIEKLGVPLTLESYPKSIDVTYKAARITVSRFPHGGKRHCQKMTFKLIDKVYQEYLRRNDNLFILFIDSDCILDKVCLQNFVYDMELSPGNRRDMLAMTGVITSTTRKHSVITLLQDMEYIHGQLFERTVESGCGSVTCLPGALTMLRFSAFRRMAKYYFADKAEQCEDLFDFAKSHLGEDRWLTHLFMIGAKKRYQIQMCTSAFCKTEAVQTMASLIKQRRRWFLGFITNEVCMLTDWRLWKRYPILVLVRFMQNTIRTTALLFFIMVLALMTTSKGINDLPVGFIAISLGLNWMLMIYFGAKLRRFKIWLYPVMFVLNPFFNWYYMVYGIFTAGQRTWGGPRADAATADGQTTAQEAIEKAEEAGDVLNIVPESFIPAAQERAALDLVTDQDEDEDGHKEGATRKKKKGKKSRRHPTAATAGSGNSTGVLLLPPDKVDGRFAAPERTPSGWYQHPDDSVFTLPSPSSPYTIGTSPITDANTKFNRAIPLHSTRTHHHHHGHHSHHNHNHHPNTSTSANNNNQRDSFDSTFSTHTTGTMSVYMPRRVESIMGDEDRRKYELAQASHISSMLSRGGGGGGGGEGGSRVWRGVNQQQQHQRGYVVGVVGDGEGSANGSGAPTRASTPGPGGPGVGGAGTAGEEGRRPVGGGRVGSYESGSGSGNGSAGASAGSGVGGFFSDGLLQQQQQQQQYQQQQGGAVDLLSGSVAGGAGGRQPLVPPPPPAQATGSRSGRSPLGRASWTRPVTRDEVEAEIEDSHAQGYAEDSWSSSRDGQGKGGR